MLERHKLIINFTPTGMIPTKDMTPHVPVGPDEIIEEVLLCAELGASIAHIHARGEDGQPTHKKEIFREIIQGIRAHNKELIICATTSGRSWPEFEKRSEVLDLDGECKPDMASLSLGSLNYARAASVNAPETIQGLLRRMNERGIKPELEVFDIGMVNYAKYLIRKELLRPPYYFNLLFGNISTAQADLLSIGHMIRELPERSVWALAGIGDCQRFVTSVAIVSGGHVRIGLEDNIFLDETRTTLATNRGLVQRVVGIAAAAGVPIATPAEARVMLGLDGG